ncbi:MAG: DNA recombination protein RmuC [Parvularcula sp.]
MSGNSGYAPTAQWDEMPEEAMARAEEQLAAMAGQADGLLSNYGWLIFLGAVIAIVALMLLYLAGRSRRGRSERPTEQDTPLFDEITEDTLQSELVYAEEAEPPAPEEVVEPLPSHHEEYERVMPEKDHDEAEVPEEDVAQPAAELDAESHAAFDEEPADEPEEDQGQRRYAFADTVPSGDKNATFARPDSTKELRDSLRGTTAPLQSDDGGAYIAPFIREDIDKAETRQNERINAVRDDLGRQIATLKSEQASRLDLVIAAIDRKLESLDRRHADFAKSAADAPSAIHVTSMNDQVERLNSAIDGQGQRIRAITTILENRSAEITQVHDAIKTLHGDVKSVREDLGRTGETVGVVKGEIDEIKENVGKLERAILDRAAQDSSTIHRLTDVIRGTLPDGTYSFGATLENGETADCLISFSGLREKVAIDAGFPMEAFHDLPSRDAVRRNLPQAKTSEDAFRRAILRSILEAADRCISPAETADSCLLFLPSEAAYTILHDRFPDLVRDSQRARVWLVSPSTLMGTLNLIRNLLPDSDDIEARLSSAREAEERQEEDNRLRQEVESLRRRAGGLAEELDRTRATLRDLISTAEQVNAAPEVETIAAEEVPASVGDDDIVEGLNFEGTPEWETVRRNEPRSTLFDDERNDPLR